MTLLASVLSLASVLAVMTLAGATAPVRAQDHSSGHYGQGHAENHDWYEKLKQPGSNASCCNGTINGVEGDCRPTRAYQKDDGMWYALLNGRWVMVPPSRVLKDLSPDGNSHICAAPSGMIFCFLGGSPKS